MLRCWLGGICSKRREGGEGLNWMNGWMNEPGMLSLS